MRIKFDQSVIVKQDEFENHPNISLNYRKKSSLASQRNFSAKRNIVIQILETFGGTFDKERRNSWKVFVARRNFF